MLHLSQSLKCINKTDIQATSLDFFFFFFLRSYYLFSRYTRYKYAALKKGIENKKKMKHEKKTRTEETKQTLFFFWSTNFYFNLIKVWAKSHQKEEGGGWGRRRIGGKECLSLGLYLQNDTICDIL